MKLPATVTKCGNLTRDPELRFAEGTGKPFARFGIAVDRPKVAGDWAGERISEFFDVITFGSLATNVAESLVKGVRVVVSGRPEIEEWDNDGDAKVTKRILANMCGPDLRWATATIARNPKAGSGSKATTVYLDEDVVF